MSINFFNMDEPNFVFKNQNALLDFDCIIEEELPEILPKKRYETFKILGRNGDMSETFGDYDAFDYPVKGITIPIERLREVKNWLTGSGKLITHNDPEKYYEAIAIMDNEVKFQNEWGVFYTFDITFHCQPLKRLVSEYPIEFGSGAIEFHNPGDVNCHPLITIANPDVYVILELNGDVFFVLDVLKEPLIIDTELGVAYQKSGGQRMTKGKWPVIKPGRNQLLANNIDDGSTLLQRSLYL